MECAAIVGEGGRRRIDAVEASLLADRQGLEGPRVQDIDRPAHVERFPHPARARRPRVQVQSCRFVPRSEYLNRIVRDRRRRRDIGQRSTVRSPEP